MSLNFVVQVLNLASFAYGSFETLPAARISCLKVSGMSQISPLGAFGALETLGSIDTLLPSCLLSCIYDSRCNISGDLLLEEGDGVDRVGGVKGRAPTLPILSTLLREL